MSATAREAVPGGVPVYSFEVEGLHNYFVAERLGADFVLVHNECQLPAIAPDLAVKGFDIHVGAVELKMLPTGMGMVAFKSVFSSTRPGAVASATRTAGRDLANPKFQRQLYRRASAYQSR